MLVLSTTVALWTGYIGVKKGLTVIESGALTACAYIINVSIVAILEILMIGAAAVMGSGTLGAGGALGVLGVGIVVIIFANALYAILGGAVFFALGAIPAAIFGKEKKETDIDFSKIKKDDVLSIDGEKY